MEIFWTASYSLMAKLGNGRRLDNLGRKEPATPIVSSTSTIVTLKRSFHIVNASFSYVDIYIYIYIY